MLRPISSMKGFTLAATDGEIGNVRDVYFDDRSWRARYLVVNTGSWLLGREVLISPQALGPVTQDRIAVNLTREKVKGAPDLESHPPVSMQNESTYRRYYGWTDDWSTMQPGLGATSAIHGVPSRLPTSVLAPDVPPPVVGDVRRAADEQTDPHLRSAREVIGYAIEATDGEIGHVEDLLIDDETWELRKIAVDTRNWWPGGNVSVPRGAAREINWDLRKLFLALTKEQIRNSPEYHDPGAVVMPFATSPSGAEVPGPLPP